MGHLNSNVFILFSYYMKLNGRLLIVCETGYILLCVAIGILSVTFVFIMK